MGGATEGVGAEVLVGADLREQRQHYGLFQSTPPLPGGWAGLGNVTGLRKGREGWLGNTGKLGR